MLSVISKKIIKPFTPTPSTKRWHKLSFTDHLIRHSYMPFVFSYPKSQVIEPKQISNLVSNSLSKILSYYYPWAGSRRENATIECDDNGAEFLEVQINSPMEEVVNHPDSNVKDLTFPQGEPWVYGMDRPLIVAQLSHFDCGGIALSVSLAHEIGDASSAYSFLRDWAALARSSNTSLSPYFVQDSFLSSSTIDGDSTSASTILGLNAEKSVQKRFIFTSTKLSALKSSIGVQNITSNEAVNALIYKCAASSATIVNSGTGSFKRSQLVHSCDLRGMLSPPLPPNSIGNLVIMFSSPMYDNEEELTLSKLVTDMKKSKTNLSPSKVLENIERVKETIDANRTGEEARRCDLYFSSSLIKYPFLQDLDFGFGKPITAGFAKGPGNKTAQYIRTNDGGIEAFVNLNEEQMCVVERDEQLLQFATPIDSNFSYEQKQQ